jgi:hypothetical protein
VVLAQQPNVAVFSLPSERRRLAGPLGLLLGKRSHCVTVLGLEVGTS